MFLMPPVSYILITIIPLLTLPRDSLPSHSHNFFLFSENHRKSKTNKQAKTTKQNRIKTKEKTEETHTYIGTQTYENKTHLE